MSRCITIIGGTGQGKSTFALKLIGIQNCFVFDYRGEDKYQHLSTDLNQPKCRFSGKPDVFMEVLKKKHNTWALFEEATIFFNGRAQEEIRELLVNKRHRKQVIIFLFHTINSVPPFIFDMTDYVILFKTGDDINTVKRKRSALLPYFLKLKNAPNHAHLMIKNF